jgi:hypothetical protein
MMLFKYIENEPKESIPYDKGVGKGRCLSWTLDCANNIWVNFVYISPDKMEVHISGRYEMNVSTVDKLYSIAQEIISLMEVNQTSDVKSNPLVDFINYRFNDS